MALPQNTDRIVGFEECGRARLDGQDSYKGMAEGSNTDEGLWIASPARTPLAEAKHIYWFGSAYDAMAFTSFIGRKTKSCERRSSFRRAVT